MPTSLSGKVVKTTLATAVAFCLIALSTMASGSFGQWTDTATVTGGTLTMGTLTIAEAGTAGSRKMTDTVSNFGAGDVVARYFGVTNSGSFTPSSMTLGASFASFSDGSTEGGTTTEALYTQGIRLQLQYCNTTGWSAASPDVCGTNGGSWANIGASRTLASMSTAVSLTSPPAAGDTTGYRVVYFFCDRNDTSGSDGWPVLNQPANYTTEFSSGCTAKLADAIMGGTVTTTFTVLASQ